MWPKLLIPSNKISFFVNKIVQLLLVSVSPIYLFRIAMVRICKTLPILQDSCNFNDPSFSFKHRQYIAYTNHNLVSCFHAWLPLPQILNWYFYSNSYKHTEILRRNVHTFQNGSCPQLHIAKLDSIQFESTNLPTHHMMTTLSTTTTKRDGFVLDIFYLQLIISRNHTYSKWVYIQRNHEDESMQVSEAEHTKVVS